MCAAKIVVMKKDSTFSVVLSSFFKDFWQTHARVPLIINRFMILQSYVFIFGIKDSICFKMLFERMASSITNSAHLGTPNQLTVVQFQDHTHISKIHHLCRYNISRQFFMHTNCIFVFFLHKSKLCFQRFKDLFYCYNNKCNLFFIAIFFVRNPRTRVLLALDWFLF